MVYLYIIQVLECLWFHNLYIIQVLECSMPLYNTGIGLYWSVYVALYNTCVLCLDCVSIYLYIIQCG